MVINDQIEIVAEPKKKISSISQFKMFKKDYMLLYSGKLEDNYNI